MSVWKKVKIKDIAILDNGINFNKSAYASGIKIIGVSDFKDRFSPDFSTLQEVKEEIVRSEDYLQPGDILFVRSNGNRDLVGRCMLIDKNILSTFSGFCIRLRINDKNTYNPYFFTYHFKAPLFRKSIAGSAIGANIQNLSQNRLGNYELNIPEYFIQCRIAEILFRYDSLIENYQKQIKLLEEAAQRLYKEWFVDLRFPGYENTKIVDGLPEGWKKKQIKDICNLITSGGTPSRNNKDFWNNGNIKWVKTKELNDTWIIDTEEYITEAGLNNSSAKLFPSNTILMAIYASPTLGRLGILGHEACCNQAALGFIPNKFVSWQWLFYKLYELRDKFNSIARGAGQQNISAVVVKDTEIVVPDKNMIDKYTSFVAGIFNQQKKLICKIKLLTEARDRMLPKLMNGEFL